VEVRGQVARPGVRPNLAGLSVRAALARSGPRVTLRGENLAAVLEEGARIDLLRDGRVTRTRMPGRRLLVLGLRIPLDSATAADLEALPGVGPVTAARIVSFRDARGPIRRLEELDAVPGIGPRTLARIRPYLRIGGGGPEMP
ncbi:MAG: ComEA family DNA-binding protein, partial [Myxococcota bacterium]